ncbi:MAG: Protease DegQ [Parcubacteria group bacterium GW2011_GWE2_38_18]|nr:MAG: Protease DegQ [Parcubacteria group bacterium GW2011_GWE2_38_18]
MDKKIIIGLLILFLGIGLGVNFKNLAYRSAEPLVADILRLDEQEATIRAIKKVSPAVVSITVYESLPNQIMDIDTGKISVKYENIKKGAGTGFLISSDGLIITNKHVVDTEIKESGSYKINLNNGKQYYAQLIGKDPLNDLALLKIFDKNLPFVELGDSDKLSAGTSVVAIGNTLGLYQNSVTKGIVSGLNRSIVASDQSGNSESLGNVIQTDAQINLGNSGGPLIDLNGKVVGVNVATDSSGSSIGFAIPINDAKTVIKSAKEKGRIIRPRLGIRYLMLDEQTAFEKKLARSQGAWVNSGKSELASVTSDSPAEKAGIIDGDIVFEINGIKVEGQNTLISITQRFKPGDKIGLKIQRGNKILNKIVVLDEFK